MNLKNLTSAMESFITSSRFAAQANYKISAGIGMLKELHAQPAPANHAAKVNHFATRNRMTDVIFVGSLVYALSINQQKYGAHGGNEINRNECTVASQNQDNVDYNRLYYTKAAYNLEQQFQLKEKLDQLGDSGKSYFGRIDGKSPIDQHMIPAVGEAVMNGELEFDAAFLARVFPRMYDQLKDVNARIKNAKPFTPALEEKAATTETNNVVRKKLFTAENYDRTYDGRATIYKKYFAETRSLFSRQEGSRTLFANTKAAIRGEGKLFAEARALWNGDRLWFPKFRMFLGLLKWQDVKNFAAIKNSGPKL